MNTTDTVPPCAVWRAVLADLLPGAGDASRVSATTSGQLPTPCSEWTVTQVVQHAAGDQLAYATMPRLRRSARPTTPSRPPETSTAPRCALVQDAIEQTAAAWATVSDDTETVPTPLPHGDLPTPVAAVMCALDAAVHAWDIAIATGRRPR